MNRLFSVLILLTALLSACTVYKEYPIDVYKPGEAAVPPEKSSVALIYRNFKYPNDSLQHVYKSNNRLVRAKNDPEGLDSIMVYACMNELAREFKSNNTFQQVHIFPYSSFERHTGEHLPELPGNLIKKITGTTQSDLLIALETFSYFFATYPEQYEMPKTNEVVTAAVWGIYDPEKEQLLERKTVIDTVFWNGYDEQGNYQQGYNPPPRLEALQIASALAGENYAKRFRASWETVTRVYSVPPLPDFEQAALYFEEGKWDQAIALWEKYSDDKNGKLAINARYNMALAYELKDNIPLAEQWLDAAYDLAESYRNQEELEMIRAYQKALDKRLQDIRKLNQMQNEEQP